MTRHLTDSRLANHGAYALYQAFVLYQTQFTAVTQRARSRFERMDWAGAHSDATERLNLYKKVVDPVVADIRTLLDDRLYDKLVWASIKAVYSSLIANRDDWEIAESFFNSATRRIFATVGVDPQIEFVDTDFDSPPTPASQPIYRTYGGGPTCALLTAILADCPLTVSSHNLNEVAQRIDAQLARAGSLTCIERAEIIVPVFYRGQGAYLVGRVWCGGQSVPLVLALCSTPQGVAMDAVLMTEDEVAILFSFTRSYFHVEADRPYDLTRFLKTLMPHKRLAEIYISIGYHKHGKTELHRDMQHHLATSDDCFEIARGERGMVMLVFTLPSYDVVFKIIKDHFAEPKTVTRQHVMNQYHLVFQHDRAGRLVDAQEFEHMKFDRRRFSPALLEELLQVAALNVAVTDEAVIIKHVYVERRVTPLNLYLREADHAAACAAVVECGNAVKDLAVTNIFTGDMLLKNFGVTRHGRVVFYDYDELCLLTDCIFRVMPHAENTDDELSAEPWFGYGENDVFPEEFKRFLGLQEPLQSVFLGQHADLFSVAFWQQVQARLRHGDLIDILPYSPQSRV